MALRKEINATYEKEGVKLSVNDFVIKAVALACKRVPDCNSAWMETFIRLEHFKESTIANLCHQDVPHLRRICGSGHW